MPLPDDGGAGGEQDPARNQFQEDLGLFAYENDRRELQEYQPQVLHLALESREYIRAMCDHLAENISTQHLKNFVRRCSKLSDVVFDDVCAEYDRNQQELRENLLRRMRNYEGAALTPRVFLRKAKDYSIRAIYDELCIAFINYLRESNP